MTTAQIEALIAYAEELLAEGQVGAANILLSLIED